MQSCKVTLHYWRIVEIGNSCFLSQIITQPELVKYDWLIKLAKGCEYDLCVVQWLYIHHSDS